MKNSYDIMIVGGGIAGSSLAIVMARAGFEVAVFEKEVEFRDRVRGEIIYPWGTAEVVRLGLYDDFVSGCGREIDFDTDHIGGITHAPTSYREVSPDKTGALAFPHHRMQEQLLERARQAGADVHRGIAVGDLRPGTPPELEIRFGDRRQALTARLLVGADGRESAVVARLGLDRHRDPEHLYTAGFQLRGFSQAKPSMHFFLDNAEGFGSVLVETAPGNHRAYLLFNKDALSCRPSGSRHYDLVMERFRKLGYEQDWLDRAEPHGVLASFDGAHRWVEKGGHPCVALVGDAAASSDPVWGNGLSRSLRSVRLLRDRLLGDTDWERAAEAYGDDHLRDFMNLRRLERFSAELCFAMGPEALARRDRAWRRMAETPASTIRISVFGPDRKISDSELQRLLA